jgi:hypothetical protein
VREGGRDSFLKNIRSRLRVGMIAMYYSKDPKEDSEVVIGGFNKDRMGMNRCYWVPVARRTIAWSVNLEKMYYGDIKITSERELMLNTSEPYIIMSRGKS